MAVTESIQLYGCEIWSDALKLETYRKRNTLVQRIGALKVASSYLTVPEPVVLVIARVVSIDLLDQKRKHPYVRRCEIGGDTAKNNAKDLIV